jgi:hypothetical protein
MAYWRSVFRRAMVDTVAFARRQSLPMRLAPSLLLPLFLFLEFSVGGWRLIWETSLAILQAYGVAFLIVYVWKFYAALPTMMRERDDQISNLTVRLTEYEREQAAPPPMPPMERQQDNLIRMLRKVRMLGHMELWLVRPVPL